MSSDTLIAVFNTHTQAEKAVMKLADSGFEMKHLSIVGQGYHTEESVIGFYNVGDKVKLWGKRGAYWGGLWGLFFGAIFLMNPVTGPIVVLGYLSTVVIAAVEGAVVVGGLSALGAALASIGVPKDSVLDYETALKTDRFLVTATGTAEELAHAHTILAANDPASIDHHPAVTAMAA
jgi:hypothetical protein